MRPPLVVGLHWSVWEPYLPGASEPVAHELSVPLCAAAH